MTTQRDRRTLERWQEWLPHISMSCRGVEHRNLLASYKVTHADYLTRLLDAGISMRAIRRMRYDDPRQYSLTFCETLKVAIEQRTERLGRKPGVKRTKEQLDHARTQRNRT